MEEVIAIWNQATSETKKYINKFPKIRLDWEDTKPIEELPLSCEIEEFLPSPSSEIVISSEDSMPNFERFVLQGSPFVRLAGLSGAAAVALGAYGAHSFPPEKQEMKRVYDTANFYHFVHTMALLAVPLARRPVVSGTLFVGGTTVFCGTIYYHALTEEKKYRKFTPYGGVMLIMGWLSLVL